jgi:hypothetical protein
MMDRAEELRIQSFERLMGETVPSSMTNWLDEKGFFRAPASTRFHGNYSGGLFDHCHAVAKTLQLLTETNDLTWDRSRSPLIVGMFHDLCKIDQYVWVPGNTSLDEKMNGKDGHYEHSGDFLIPGHGEKSVMYLAAHMMLTEEEVICIRWHMGAFDDKENWDYYTRAVHKYPNLLWTHHADMYAAQVLNT